MSMPHRIKTKSEDLTRILLTCGLLIYVDWDCVEYPEQVYQQFIVPRRLCGFFINCSTLMSLTCRNYQERSG